MFKNIFKIHKKDSPEDIEFKRVMEKAEGIIKRGQHKCKAAIYCDDHSYINKLEENDYELTTKKYNNVLQDSNGTIEIDFDNSKLLVPVRKVKYIYVSKDKDWSDEQ